MKIDWVNITNIIMALTLYMMSLVVIIPIILIGKDPSIPAYTVLKQVFISIELVGGCILAFGYLMRRARRRGG